MVSSRPLPLPPLHNQQSVARGSGKEKEATETDAAALNSRAGAGRWLRGVPCLTICDGPASNKRVHEMLAAGFPRPRQQLIGMC